MGKVCVLSIGVNKYLHFPEAHLNFCVNDAKIIYDKYSQYNCEFKELLLDGTATRERILTKLEDLNKISRDDDYFVFNFAGHGFTNAEAEEEINSKNSFICTHDFNGYIHTAISFHDLKEAITSIKASSKFVIFDSCHSGGALRRDFPLLHLREIKTNKLFELFGEYKGTCFITACDSDETAMEKPELKHGVFTYHLIECLEEAYAIDPHVVPYMTLYDMVCEAVRKSTGDSQNPMIHCSNDDFKILVLPPSELVAKKEIKLDTTIIPTVQISKASEYYDSGDLEKFERIVIHLIQEDRFIEIDKLVKDQLQKIHIKLSHPDISLYAEQKDAISYYESCREYIKPLLILTRYITEYYDPKYIMNSLNYIARFEELTRYKNGYTAIIEIPLIIISEIILNLTILAYETKNYTILKKLLETSINNNRFNSRIIYDSRSWHPHLFGRNVEDYIKYIFPNNNDDLLITSRLRSFIEVNFLFDCYSINFSYPNTCYPVYLIYEDFDVPERMVSKLLSGDPDTINFIKEVFSINDVNDFLKSVTDRLSKVSEWSSSKFHNNDYYLNPLIEKINKR